MVASCYERRAQGKLDPKTENFLRDLVKQMQAFFFAPKERHYRRAISELTTDVREVFEGVRHGKVTPDQERDLLKAAFDRHGFELSEADLNYVSLSPEKISQSPMNGPKTAAARVVGKVVRASWRTIFNLMKDAKKQQAKPFDNNVIAFGLSAEPADAARYALRTIPDYAHEVIETTLKMLEMDALHRSDVSEDDI